jgi:hypothetical protein
VEQGSEENYIMRSLMICTSQYCVGNEIENNGMGGACSAYGEEERCTQGFGGETCGKEPLRRPRLRWNDNIKIDI